MVELPANATVQWKDGKAGTVDLGAGGIASNDPGEYYEITKVELPNSAHLHGRYTLESGETNISNISTSNLSKNFAVVVVIHHDDHVISWVSSTCDGDLVGLKVISRYSGSSSTYDCDEGAF